jgi:hypothetical protein
MFGHLVRTQINNKMIDPVLKKGLTMDNDSQSKQAEVLGKSPLAMFSM